ncbi:carbonic anhydrase 4-like [Neoarius graeffei]|uniref:carbonic anhydrase 4-like n=1 Tax=Neoarius graeffei TaxID=443677 RepID=UPI00298C3037|nr:carbonic anhydrase 4-like [Neoarius graeffei]
MQAHILGLLLASVWSECTGLGNWCYQSQVTCESRCVGPDAWSEVGKDCMKNRQSPINIVTRKTVVDDSLTPLKFTGYQEAFNGILVNNGHTVTMSVTHLASVSGGNLGATYKALQFHFHWGEDGGPGSEHTIDGEQYPMEMHIVHIRNDFKSLEEALKDPKGVAVLGFFYEKSKSANKKYDGLIQAVRKVESTDTNTTVSGISLSNLISSEENMTKYFRYEGSLTTPNCTESVVWTVFENPIPLSKDQLSVFSSLKFHDDKKMIKTFRPVQPLNDRKVYRSSSTVIMLSFTLLLMCVCSALGLFQHY